MTIARRSALFAAAALILALPACSRVDNDATPADNVAINDTVGDATMNGGTAASPASFNFADGSGKAMGSGTFSTDASGATITVNASGLPAGVHGIHLHEKGVCEGPKFESAGGHWNPAAKKHGRDNPAGAHLGDLANLDVAGAGTATTNFTVAGGGDVADADGTSIVIHAKADDYKTDPSGDSGDRIACAVIAAPE